MVTIIKHIVNIDGYNICFTLDSTDVSCDRVVGFCEPPTLSISAAVLSCAQKYNRESVKLW